MMIKLNIEKRNIKLKSQADYHILQDSKTVTPTEAVQTVTPDTGYDAIKSVTVNPIPSNYGDATDATVLALDLRAGIEAIGIEDGSAKSIIGTVVERSASDVINDVYSVEGKHRYRLYQNMVQLIRQSGAVTIDNTSFVCDGVEYTKFAVEVHAVMGTTNYAVSYANDDTTLSVFSGSYKTGGLVPSIVNAWADYKYRVLEVPDTSTALISALENFAESAEIMVTVPAGIYDEAVYIVD